MLTPNSILQNRYRVVRELGHGGMGTVYEAVDQRVKSIVALKETIAGTDEQARRAFEREASLLGNLRHPSLPKVMDYFTEEGGDFLVMEFIAGTDLGELLEQRGRAFPQDQVLRWADELLKVLEYLHGQEPPILHRDIKPSNLKLTERDEIFLLDFGLAKGSAGQMSTMMASRSVRGYTPAYASLEQITGHGTDPRSDLYSLAATVYHLLTGVGPVDAPTRFNLIEEDRPDPLAPIESLNSQISPKVAAVIQQAMAVSRKHRPMSATVMRNALRNALAEDELARSEESQKSEEETKYFVKEPAAVEEDLTRNAANIQPTMAAATTPQVSTETSPAKEDQESPTPTKTMVAPHLPASHDSGAVVSAAPKPKSKVPLLVIAAALVLVLLGTGTTIAVLYWRGFSIPGLTSSAVKVTAEDLALVAGEQPPETRTRLATDAEARKEFVTSVRQLLAVAEVARAKGIGDRPEIKRKFALTRSIAIAQKYNETQGGSNSESKVSDADVDLFMKEAGQEALFNQFLEDAKAQNPAQQVSDEQVKQVRRQWGQVMVAERRGVAAGLDKRRALELQIMLEQSRVLAQTYAEESLTPEKNPALKASDAEIDDYIAKHPELDSSKDRATADDVLRRVRGGEDFAMLAKQFSSDPGTKDKGGDLGWFSRGQMVPEFDKAAFELQPGQRCRPDFIRLSHY